MLRLHLRIVLPSVVTPPGRAAALPLCNFFPYVLVFAAAYVAAAVSR